MFFNFDPLAKRAPKDARDHADEMPGFQAAGMGRTVSVGYDSGRPDPPRRAFRPAAAGTHRSAAAHSHAGSWF
jgi:hypothetical protein